MSKPKRELAMIKRLAAMGYTLTDMSNDVVLARRENGSFTTWLFNPDATKTELYHGHYDMTLNDAVRNYNKRVDDSIIV